MNETLGADGVADILDFTMYPWGNAYYNTTECATSVYDKPTGMYCWIKECNVENPPSDCFRGDIWCQHGDEECAVDRTEGCVIVHFPEPARYSVFMSCYEGSDSPDFDECASQAGIDQSTSAAIKKCAAPGSVAGNAIEAANAKATVALGDSKLGTPWVIVNGVQLENPDTLLETVCNAYKGPAPAGCP
mmetsp:Transcript_40046/g.58909  ORF Transcript_40046/g.58909 Transcript_40046/m.58909 type:complete len:189 (-) Transcript_40046:250-816(-)